METSGLKTLRTDPVTSITKPITQEEQHYVDALLDYMNLFVVEPRSRSKTQKKKTSNTKKKLPGNKSLIA
jgi:hypothetical protein